MPRLLTLLILLSVLPGESASAFCPCGAGISTCTGPTGAVTSSLEYQGYTQAAQDADGTWSTYFYDDWARHWKTTDGRNNSTEYVFAANDSIFTIKAPSSGASGTDDTVRTFDTLGRVATETKPGAGATTYTYDAAGRLAQQSGALTYTSSYGYDLTGRMTSRTKL